MFLIDADTLFGKPPAGLQAVADLLAEGSQVWIKALGHAAQIGRAASRAETEDVLVAIDRVAALKHEADDARRALGASAIEHAKDFRQLYVLTSVGTRLSAAAAALKHASMILREHALEDVVGDCPLRYSAKLPLALGGAEEGGNKARNLMRMAQAGLPVPPAFVLPAAWCARGGPADQPARRHALADGIAALERATDLGFGAARRPLLVSVRSGVAVSMQGMMETVLDVGLNMDMVQGLIC